ncbi:MAG: hypothetical protein WCO67_09565, partial [Betaproteobacteria bacterium]
GAPVTVTSNDGKGSSGLIDMSMAGAYVPDVSANVFDNEEGGVVVSAISDLLRVFEQALLSGDPRLAMVIASYTVVLTRAPEDNVYVTAKPGLPKEADRRAGSRGVGLSTSATAAGDESGVTLVFNRSNWFTPQTVYISALQDAIAYNPSTPQVLTSVAFAEGNRTYAIQHSVKQGVSADDGEVYDGVKAATVAVEVIDKDSSTVVVSAASGGGQVMEDNTGTVNYRVVLSRAPSADVDVFVTHDGQIDVTGNASSGRLTFTTANWMTPQSVTVAATSDTLVEGTHYSRIDQSIDPADLNAFLNLTTDDAARGLMAKLIADTSGNYKVTVSGNALTVERDLLSGGGFTLPTASLALVAFTGTPSVDNVVASDWYTGTANIAIGIAGTVTAGERWTMKLDGVEKAYAFVAGDTATSVATAVKDMLSGTGYTVGVDVTGTTVTVKKADNSAFSLRVSDAATLATHPTATVTGTHDPLHWSKVRLTFGASTGAAITKDSTWSATLNGTAYTFVAGSDAKATVVAPVDITITDSDMMQVLVTQSGGSTDVIEPTSTAKLGSGSVGSVLANGAKLVVTGTGITAGSISITPVASTGTQSDGRFTIARASDGTSLTVAFSGTLVIGEKWKLTVTDGGAAPVSHVYTFDTTTTSLLDLATGLQALIGTSATATAVTQIAASFGTPILYSNQSNSTVATAQSTDFASWSNANNVEFFDSTSTSTTITPHVTVKGVGTGQLDYYSFTVTQSMIDTASGHVVRGTFDIDHGFGIYDPQIWASQLSLYGSTGQLLSKGRGWSVPDAGSTTWLDDFLTYDFTQAGTYTIGVSNWIYWLNNWSTGIPKGVDYDLQISLDRHAVSGFVFAPSPIIENTTSSSTVAGQSIDTQSDWYTFFNPSVGNSTFGNAVPIDSTVPYTTIKGTGDGLFDTYNFEITNAMLGADSLLTPTGTTEGKTYYTSASIPLTGAIAVGDVWTLTIDGRNYGHTVAATSETTTSIATALYDRVVAQKPAGASYQVARSADTLSITDASGFWFDLKHQVAKAAAVVESGKVATGTSGTPTFSSATVTLGGTVEAGQTWSLALTSGSTINTATYTWLGTETLGGQTALDYIARQLRTQVGGFVVGGVRYTTNSGTSPNVRIDLAAGFSVNVSISGATAGGSAAISGTPLSTANVRWTSADIGLAGTPGKAEDWIVTLSEPDSSTLSAPQTFTFHVSALSAENIDAIGTQLATDITNSTLGTTIQAQYVAGSANSNSGTLRLSAKSTATRSDAFTVASSVVAGTQGAITAVTSGVVTHTGTVGTPATGEIWGVVVVDTSGTTPVVYSGNHTAVTGNTAAALATALATSLNASSSFTNAGYGAAADGGTIVVSNTAGNAFTVGINPPLAATSQAVTLSGTAAAGNVWAVKLVNASSATLDTAVYAWTGTEVVTSGQELNYIATQLKTQLETTPVSGYSYAVLGSSLVATRADGTSFNLLKSSDGAFVSLAPVNHDVVLSGTASVGQTWALRLNDTTTTANSKTVWYTWLGTEVVTAGQELEYIAGQLAGQINGVGGYTAKAVGKSVAADKSNTTFTLTDATLSTAAAFTDVITLGNSSITSASAGQRWQINLLESGRVVQSAFRDVTATTALTALATALAGDLTSGNYTATASGGTITIKGAAAFTAQLAPVATSATTLTSGAQLRLTTPTLVSGTYSGSVAVGTDATPVAGTVWTFVLTDGTATKIASYTWLGTETGTAANVVASALSTDLGAAGTFTLNSHAYTVSASSNTVTIATTSAFTIAVSTAGVATLPVDSSLAIAGTVSPGKLWAVTLTDGTTKTTATYTAVSADTSTTNIATGLAASLVTALGSGYTVSRVGDAVVVSKTGTGTISLADARGASATQADHGLTLSGTPVSGQVWLAALTVGTTVYTAIYDTGTSTTTTLGTVATGLAANLATASNKTVVAVGNTIFVNDSASTYSIAANSALRGATEETATTERVASASLVNGTGVTVTAGTAVRAN